MILRRSPIGHHLPQVDRALEEFAEQYFENGAMRMKPPQDNVLRVDGLTGIVLYREPPHQVELILFEPNCRVPQHVHPHIDSIEVAYSGWLELWVAGRRSTLPEMSTRADGMARDLLRWIPIPRASWHGGTILQKHAIFLSVQRWEDLAPTHVVLDWRGEPLGPEHEQALAQ